MIDPEQPIQDPGDFYGRRNTLRRLFSRIGAERPQSVAVIGGSRSGKTSLLNYVAHESTRGQYLEDPGVCRFGRVDCRDTQLHDAQTFVGRLSTLLDGNPTKDADPYQGLQSRVESHHTGGFRLVFLLDDFHLITGNTSFALEFFSFLRSLANNYNLAYITSSFLELQKLCVVKDIEESPFFNIFTNLSLGPLDPDEARALFGSLTGSSGEAIHRLAAWTGGYPYLLKRVARRIQESGLDPATLDPEKSLLPQLSAYYESIMAILPPDALGPLKSLARDRSPDPREGYVLRPLIKQGFLREEGETISCFAPSFAAFLRRSLSKKMLAGRS